MPEAIVFISHLQKRMPSVEPGVQKNISLVRNLVNLSAYVKDVPTLGWVKRMALRYGRNINHIPD